MGQWNTLHIIDEEKLKNEIIPSMKNNSLFIEKYVNQYANRIFLEPTKSEKSKLIDRLIEISNEMISDFKVHPLLIGDFSQEEFRKRYYSIDFENFRIIFHKIVFSECALAFPYFSLGYRLVVSYVGYKPEESKAKGLVDSIQYFIDKGGVFPGEFGIRNWIDSETVNVLYNHLEEIVPILYSSEYQNHNRLAKIFINSFKGFTKLAYENKFGLVS